VNNTERRDIDVRVAAAGEGAPNVEERVALVVLMLFAEDHCAPGPMTKVIAVVRGYLDRTRPAPSSSRGGAA
jgi:hypothetical protein